MTSTGDRVPRLLRADQEQLERAAELLRGAEPAFMIVVCAAELVQAARARLSEPPGVELPEPMVLEGSEDTLGALVNAVPTHTSAQVRSFALGGDAKEALRALNWHREKLLKGAPVVLWLDGVQGLRELRETAPDAYSFRDMVVLVRGDGGRLPQVPHRESSNVLGARRGVARAKTALERARGRVSLSDALRTDGHLIDAENVAKQGLEFIPEETCTEEGARVTRAHLWARLAMAASQRGAQTRRRHAAQRGLEQIQGLTSAEAQEALVWLLVVVSGPFRDCDRPSAERALLLIDGIHSNTGATAQARRTMSWIALDIGDTLRARRLLRDLDAVRSTATNSLYQKLDQGNVEVGAGRMLDAESYFRDAVSLTKRGAVIPAGSVGSIADAWMRRGELDIAERVVRESLPETEPALLLERSLSFCKLALTKGDLPAAQILARDLLRDAAQWGLDQPHRAACLLLAEIATEASDANQYDAPTLSSIAIDLEVAADVHRSLADNDPAPWDIIRFLRVRADVLVRAERIAEALDLGRCALTLARTSCRDLIPEAGRALADHLLRAANLDEAFALVADVEPEATSRGMLKELARLRAARVIALVLRNDAPAAVESSMASLRQCLESTGAPRIKAETLLDLAVRLPPATIFPDPLVLAGETHTLFVEMPMPAEDARSLELAGDVLAARGKPADARRRYVMAQGILERRGLGLRLPLLAAKVARMG